MTHIILIGLKDRNSLNKNDLTFEKNILCEKSKIVETAIIIHHKIFNATFITLRILPLT